MPSPSKSSLRLILLLVLVTLAGSSAFGKTPNGNEFALYLTEAKTDTERKALVSQALGQQHSGAVCR